MNIAVIFAGGTGKRMNSSTVPKQFLQFRGKPILVYTLEKFQQSEAGDAIMLVILAEWIDYCHDLVRQYGLDKVREIIPGGDTGQNSILNGISKAAEIYDRRSIVLIHDGVRPLIDSATINACIDSVNSYGSAITVTNAIETIAADAYLGKAGTIIDRSRCLLIRAPQCFYLGDVYDSHRKAAKEGLSFIDTASLMQHYGYDLYTVMGPVENIKITTPEDFYIFGALIDAFSERQTL